MQTTKDIDFVYTALVNALYNTGNLCIPVIPFKPYLKPYWCSELTTLNKTMKSIRREWLQSGSSRDCPLFKKLKSSKSIFRNAHRKATQTYLHKLYDDIDRSAEIDQEQFWRLVNLKRKSGNTCPGSEIIFNGEVCRDKDSIIKGWTNYFRDLYAFDENPAYDNTFRTHVDNELDILFSSSNECNSNTPCKVSIDQVHSALKSTNRNKAPGADNICYEHLLFGGTLVRKVLV